MYSTKKNVLQLVALMRAHHIKYAVLCPGSRNAPIVQTLAACPDFTCYSIVDERSAAFFALGLAQAHHAPVAVCCTSGTALLNMAPAVAEAYYQEIPLLVISADRPESWIGQKDGQTLPQPRVFGALVQQSVQLPEPTDRESAWHCNRLINDALLALYAHEVYGPVHINVPISEPFLDFSATELPVERRIKRLVRGDSFPEFIEMWNKASKVMVVVGQMKPDYEYDCLFRELEEKGCVVVYEQLSNCPDTQCNESGIYYHPDWNLMTTEARRILSEGTPFPLPELVLCCGGHIVSKNIKKFLRALPEGTLFVQSANHGDLADTYQRASHLIEGNILSILWDIANNGNRKDLHHQKAWSSLSENVHKAIGALPPSHSSIYRVRQIMELLPHPSALHLANSNAVRLAELATLNPDVQVFGNRGTSGIDGSLSTAAGYAAADLRNTYIIIGDLSYFYDLSVLRHSSLFPRLRIVLLHNGGGAIFQTLPGMSQASQLKLFIAASHSTETFGWLQDCGIAHYLIEQPGKDSEETLQLFLEDHQPRPALLELRFDAESDRLAYEAFYAQFRGK